MILVKQSIKSNKTPTSLQLLKRFVAFKLPPSFQARHNLHIQGKGSCLGYMVQCTHSRN